MPELNTQICVIVRVALQTRKTSYPNYPPTLESGPYHLSFSSCAKTNSKAVLQGCRYVGCKREH